MDYLFYLEPIIIIIIGGLTVWFVSTKFKSFFEWVFIAQICFSWLIFCLISQYIISTTGYYQNSWLFFLNFTNLFSVQNKITLIILFSFIAFYGLLFYLCIKFFKNKKIAPFCKPISFILMAIIMIIIAINHSTIMLTICCSLLCFVAILNIIVFQEFNSSVDYGVSSVKTVIRLVPMIYLMWWIAHFILMLMINQIPINNIATIPYSVGLIVFLSIGIITLAITLFLIFFPVSIFPIKKINNNNLVFETKTTNLVFLKLNKKILTFLIITCALIVLVINLQSNIQFLLNYKFMHDNKTISKNTYELFYILRIVFLIIGGCFLRLISLNKVSMKVMINNVLLIWLIIFIISGFVHNFYADNAIQLVLSFTYGIIINILISLIMMWNHRAKKAKLFVCMFILFYIIELIINIAFEAIFYSKTNVNLSLINLSSFMYIYIGLVTLVLIIWLITIFSNYIILGEYDDICKHLIPKIQNFIKLNVKNDLNLNNQKPHNLNKLIKLKNKRR